MIVDDAFANDILDALAGPGLAAGLLGTMWVALYDDDPSDGGLEVTGGGYARLGPVDMTDAGMWPAASGREKTTGDVIAAPNLTDVLDTPATWAAFVDTASGAVGTTAYAQQLPVTYAGAAGERPSLAAGDVKIRLTDLGGIT